MIISRNHLQYFEPCFRVTWVLYITALGRHGVLNATVFPFFSCQKGGFIVVGGHDTIIFSYGMFIVHFASSQLTNVLSWSFTNPDEREENLWLSARLKLLQGDFYSDVSPSVRSSWESSEEPLKWVSAVFTLIQCIFCAFVSETVVL